MPAWTPSPRPDDAIVGVRLFRVAAGGMLQSLNHGCGWLAGVNDAEPDGCGCEASPGHDCHCGLNAFHSLQAAAGDSYEHYEQWAPAGKRVVAAVAGWGDVEVHADGWRAEHAEIVAIGAPDPMAGAAGARDLAARAAARYGVPLVALESLEAYAREHGQPARPDQIPDRAAVADAPDTNRPSAPSRRLRVSGEQVFFWGALIAGLAIWLNAMIGAIIADESWRVITCSAGMWPIALLTAILWADLEDKVAAGVTFAALTVLLTGIAGSLVPSTNGGRPGLDRDALRMVADAERRLIADGQRPRTPAELAAADPQLREALDGTDEEVLITGAPGSGLRVVAVKDADVTRTTTVPWPRTSR